MALFESKRFQQGFLLALGAATLTVCFAIVQPFLMPLVAATALAILFYPLHHRVERVVGRKGLAAGISVCVVVLLVLVPAILIGSAISREVTQFYQLAATKSAAGGGWAEYTANLLHRAIVWAGVESPETEEQIRTALVGRLQALGGFAFALGRDLVTNLVSMVVSVVVTLFSLFFLFRDGVRLKHNLTRMIPLAPGAVHRLFTDIGESVLANVYGIGAVALAQGGLTGLIFFVLGIPSPVLWGTAAGLLSMIPILGPAIIWVPAALALGLSGSWGKAAILVAFGAGGIGLADNFIRPYVISGRVNLHPLLVFFALLGGAQAFGFLGLFIGPAALSITVAVIELLREEASVAPPSAPPSL